MIAKPVWRTSWTLALLALLAALPGKSSAAAEKTVDNILNASVTPAAGRSRTLILHARVRLDNSCLTHPRFSLAGPRPAPDGSAVLSVAVVARSSQGAGVMCAMHVTDADVPPLALSRRVLAGVRSIRVTGKFKSSDIDLPR
ncbi:MAG TPA: hypothetical protein VG248_03950 [Caulobacteraceae bacterium]|jgi:hypothetical protein|nr:hypothetical protein [Caulobacteraceae bacterium]